MNRITLPPGFFLFPGHCSCGAPLIKVDELEGLPIFGCPAGCGREGETPPAPGEEVEFDGQL